MADLAASTLAKLKMKAQEQNLPFQQMLILFCQEEILRKISKSKYNNNIILKGGLLIYSLSNFSCRPTIDADYLLTGCSNNIKDIQNMVNDIINIPTENKFISYEVKNFKKIAEQRKYNGIRANLIGKIKNTRTHLSIDFAVGDIVVPPSQKQFLPVILSDFKKPNIFTYSLESVISEKLDAIISRMETTSRMKDFYDIYYLAKNYDFDGRKLQEAIYRTLSKRGTPYEKDSVYVINRLGDDDIIIKRWKNFCKNVLRKKLDIIKVLNLITDFLSPPYFAIVQEDEFFGHWNSEIESYINIKNVK